MPNTENLNIVSNEVLLTPVEMNTLLPLSKENERLVIAHRQTLQNILSGKDKRLFVVVGPCSIHDVKAAKDYAKRLKKLADEVSEKLFLVMRVYFEKPRTTTGWKGLINDPHLNGSFDIVNGLKQARKLMIDLVDAGLPIATEALDPISPQYLADLVSWSAIGARTTESQTHREMASGLSSPVGFKNGTDGSLQVAIDALQAVSSPHRFLGINRQGQVAIVRTKGNKFGHVVLRGGGGKPNYDINTVEKCEKRLIEKELSPNIVIDCSHENSNKKPENQEMVFKHCIDQRLQGKQSIVGMMLESNLDWGNQKIPEDLSELKYGVSVTDACIDWETTERIILETAKQLADDP
ncbi:MAG TPA: 3-deoxy-7-phosphoheptulonate synthase [Leucothrix sp.]|nr:3-deoxy-7-phosphoheptulonate synthase [Leucothrix sp.]